jgi:hypothetical protein
VIGTVLLVILILLLVGAPPTWPYSSCWAIFPVVGLASWSFLDAQLARGGVLLWVRTPDFNAERRALEVLHRHAAHVHLHVRPAEPPPGECS